MKKLFQAPAFIKGISTLSDRTMKLTCYISKELVGEEKAKLFDFEAEEGWLLFSPNPIKIEDVPLEDAEVKDGFKKSLSQRLYNTMFVYYKQNNSDLSGFNKWREDAMEKIIQQYKDKLI